MSKKDIEEKIAQYSKKLDDINNGIFVNDDETQGNGKRIKKRVLQHIGKLKKQLILLENNTGGNNINQSNNDAGIKRKHSDNNDDNSNNKKILIVENNDNDVEDNRNNNQKDNEQDNIEQEIDSSETYNRMSRKKMKVKVKLLNQELSSYAQKKHMKLAIKRFNWGLKKGFGELYDVHTYTNFLNAYVRCGDLDGAMNIYRSMLATDTIEPNVVTYTSLLKGYCESGNINIAKGILFGWMENDTGDWTIPWVPNVRAVNTFLRGCVRAGSVIDAQHAFDVYFGHNVISNNMSENYRYDLAPKLTPDLASLEYMVSLYCQSLQLSQARELVGIAVGLKERNINNINGGDESIFISSMCLSLAKAYAIFGSTSTKSLSHHWLNKTRGEIELSKESVLKNKMEKRFKKNEKVGNSDNKEDELETKGSRSMELFLSHRRSEIEKEISLISNFLDNSNFNEKFTGKDGFGLVDHLSRVIHFESLSYKTETKLISSSDNYSNIVNTSLVNVLKSNFGLNNVNNLVKSKSPQLSSSIENVINRVAKCIDSENSQINFSQLFSSNNHSDAIPIKLEICSGSGEWVVAQALHDWNFEKNSANANWVALELRFDRVYNTMCRSIYSGIEVNNSHSNKHSKSHFGGLPNLAVLGGDASALLPNHIPSNCISSIFINHPEPPERTGGESDSQGDHLLTKDFFINMHKILKIDGTITIVTDNMPYGLSLVKSLSSLASSPKTVQTSFVSVIFDNKENERTIQEVKYKLFIIYFN
jgi:pentatricopeptide repeat protein